MKHIDRFNESESNNTLNDLREQIRNIIASDWAKHEDDYPYIEQTVEDCMIAIKEFLNK
jgi:hypothetical protein